MNTNTRFILSVATPLRNTVKTRSSQYGDQALCSNLLNWPNKGDVLDHRPERLIQQIFAKVVVEPAAGQNLLGDPEKLFVSGDGTRILSSDSA
ncbi:MAG: hypothetical protein SCM11_14820 [Bacillota bacterium]|nr:hypothetical protein [Bacillota bacterium]